MKNLFKMLSFSVFVLFLISCSDDYGDKPADGPTVTTFNATLLGSNEVPSNNSTATGTATLTFNNSTKIFTIAVTHSVATTTMGHIHMGLPTANGGVVFGFPNFASPIAYTSVALTTAQEADLNANMYYVNIHSTAFPGGEVRGQLIRGATTRASSRY